MTRIVIIFIVAASLLSCQKSDSPDAPVLSAFQIDIVDSRRSLEESVAIAKVVAIIKVSDVRQVKGPETTCGWDVTAKASEILKGVPGDLQFFVGRTFGTIKPGDSYLVFLYGIDQWMHDVNASEIGAGSADVSIPPRCNSQSKLYVPNSGPTLWRIVDEGLKSFPPPAIVQGQRQGVFWCAYSNGAPFQGNFENKLFKSESRIVRDATMGSETIETLIELATARRLVQRAIANSPYSLGTHATFSTSFRPNFHFGPC
ncbi:MAG: hypothetical protein AB7T20_05495 [Steroidobacteraceae bacterium]